MPFYKISDMEAVRASVGPATAKTAPGELMKVGVVTYLKGEGATPHYHPNEEQFLLILEGRQWMIVGDEEKLIGPGDLVHIPGGPSTAASSLMRCACSPPRVPAGTATWRRTTTRRAMPPK